MVIRNPFERDLLGAKNVDRIVKEDNSSLII